MGLESGVLRWWSWHIILYGEDIYAGMYKVEPPGRAMPILNDYTDLHMVVYVMNHIFLRRQFLDRFVVSF